MTVKLVPSDPEFPFEMAFLDCVLHVPLSYPDTASPTLQVRNKEMGRGYQINVEKGFDALVLKSPSLTLLGLMNALDRQLETLLSAQKADTIKLVANSRKPSSQESESIPRPTDPLPKLVPSKAPPARPVEPTYSAEQRAEASVRREAETRQLEARLGRLPLFQKSSDGIAYTLPIEPRRRDELSVPLQSIKTTRLFVPFLYPLLPCRISLQGVSRDAAIVTEKAFERRASETPEMSLMAQINYLATNMHVFAAEEVAEEVEGEGQRHDLESLELHDDREAGQETAQSKSLDYELEGRSHIHLIPRPPEWNVEEKEDSDLESDYSEDFSDQITDEESDPHADEPAKGPERGIAISFPLLEMYGIELLELTSLCIAVKCGRCKDTLDVSNLRHSDGSGMAPGGLRNESCKKCANVLSLGEFAYVSLCGNYALLMVDVARISQRAYAC